MILKRKGAKARRRNKTFAPLRLCVTVFLVLALLWLLSWVGARALIVRAPLEHADAIVVLSGSSTLAERTQHAASLYSQNRAPKILLTTDNQQGGWSTAEQRNPYFHEIAVKELIRLGVPAQNVEVVRPAVNSTWDEAQLISEYSKTHNLHSILIVTSGYHSRRAFRTFRTLFQDTTQVGIDPVETGIQTPRPATWWMYPRGWQLVFVEYLKLIYYLCRSL